MAWQHDRQWPSATHPARVVEATIGLMLGCALLGCGDAAERASVYEEVLAVDGLADSRTHALRVTVFQFAEEIGGYVVFYEIDGAFNTPREPYFVPSGCAYFGPGALRANAFRISARGVADAPLLIQARFEPDTTAEFTGTLTRAGGIVTPGFDPGPAGVAMRFSRVEGEQPRSTCPTITSDRPLQGVGE